MVKDISMNGFKVILDKALKYLSEDLNSFHIILNEGKVLKLSGRVIWQRSYPDRIEAGIKFAGVSDYHKEDIYNYIFKHQRQELTEQWWQM